MKRKMDGPVTRHIIVGLAMLIYCRLASVDGRDIRIRNGELLALELPDVTICGPYTLLNPALQPIVVVEPANITVIIGTYVKRASIEQKVNGTRLTITEITHSDAGKYKVAASTVKHSSPCNESYNIQVEESSDEYMGAWSQWSSCSEQCAARISRSRSRNCSIPGGCVTMGPARQVEPCDRADHCPQWSEWGQWGSCSAKCGKGFKIRKRLCLSGKSSLMHSSECQGQSSQSQMCLTVCEVFGTWTDWSTWSACSLSKTFTTSNNSATSSMTSRGVRSRTRSCSTDGRQQIVTSSCDGKRHEEEDCDVTTSTDSLVTQSTVTTYHLNVTNTTLPQENSTVLSQDVIPNDVNLLHLVAMATGVVFALAFLVTIVVLIILKRKRSRSRRESAPTLRPADSASNRREKQRTKDRRSGTPIGKSGSDGNFYSELNSSFVYPSGEFDSTYALDETDGYQQENGGYDRDFDDNPNVTGRDTICERTEIIYEKSRVSCQKSPNFNEVNDNTERGSSQSDEYQVITENILYEPPELWSNEDVRRSFENNDVTFATFFGSNRDIDDINRHQNAKTNGHDTDHETETVYYEPPNEKEEFEEDIFEEKRRDSAMTDASVYQNYKDLKINRTEDELNDVSQNVSDISYEIPGNVQRRKESEISRGYVSENEIQDNDADVPGVTLVNMRNGSIVTIDERVTAKLADDERNKAKFSDEELDSEHIYMNATMAESNSSSDFYVTPKYHYGLGMKLKGDKRGSKHIYDIPKNVK